MATLARPHGNSVVLLRPLATLLGRLGSDGPRFLAQLGVTDDTPPDAYVPDLAVDRALDGIAEERGDETFGLTLAHAAVAQRPLGLFGNLVWLSGTLRDALARAGHYYALVTHRASLVVHADGASGVATVTRCLAPGAARGPILAEYMFATLVLRATEATGGAFKARAMRFAGGPRDAAPYEALFRVPVTFDPGPDAVEQLTMDAAQLDLPLLGSDPYTVAAIESHVRQLDIGGEPLPLADRVRRAVQTELRSGSPSLETVAHRLGVGARALRRHLQEQRVSFRAIVASAQTDRARELLTDGASIKAVAFALGFSEPSAFSRAYKRWTGRPPSGGA